MGSVAGTLVCRWRVGTEHLCAPFGTVPILPEHGADAAEAKDPTDGRGEDGFERVSP